MAKEIKITIYTPKELWIKFCNWAFWPRRKKCADWLELLRVYLDNEITKMLIDKYNAGLISDTMVGDLEVEIRAIIKREINKMKEVMSKPY